MALVDDRQCTSPISQMSDEALNKLYYMMDGSFDEWRYLNYNPDIAERVRLGQLDNGEEHFLKHGANELREGRRNHAPSVHEHSYLLRNPDVVALIEAGKFSSGKEHWEAIGRAEEEAGQRKPYVSSAPKTTDDVDFSTWKDGYLHLKGMFSEDECEHVNESVERLIAERERHGLAVEIDVDLNLSTERKETLANVDDTTLQHPFKINTLYYWLASVRRTILDKRITRILRTLLDGDPTALTSLNFRKGSQQALHLDTFYMPPTIPHRMVAAWVALEDVTEDNGPLLYIPGSNRIPPYYFSGHTMRALKPETDYSDFAKYYGNKISEYGLETKKLSAKKGDVFIWHAQLYHGGALILNPELTRKSVFAHFFSAADYPGGSCTGNSDLILFDEGSYYENRPSLVAPKLRSEQLSFK